MSKTTNPKLEKLKQAFADMADTGDLVSLIAYGDFEKSLTQSNPLAILVVAKQSNLETLRRLRTAFQKAKTTIPLSPLVATPKELTSSCDVFPVTFLELRQSYVVLLGKDILVDLEISDEHLRLRCEQELKNLLLRMQTWFMKQDDQARLQNLLSGFWASFLRSLHASLKLTTGKWPDWDEEILASAARTMGLNAQSLQRCDRFASAAATPEDSLEEVWLATIENVAAAAHFVDQLPVHCGAVEILDSSEDQ